MKIDHLIDFLKLTHRFRMVTRRLDLVGEDRKENDAEHSYEVAIVAWYLVSRENLPLDKDLVIKYALVHDFAEAYAGDTWFFRDEKESRKKEEREQESRARLLAEFPDFPDLHELLQRYEEKADPESRFVYALDKLLPVVNNYLGEGKNWKRDDITYENVWNGKLDKIAISPEIQPYFAEIMAILDKNRNLFALHVEQPENQ